MGMIRSLRCVWRCGRPRAAVTLSAFAPRSIAGGARAAALPRGRGAGCRGGGAGDRNLGAVGETGKSDGDDALGRLKTFGDHGLDLVLLLHRDGTHGDGAVVLDH